MPDPDLLSDQVFHKLLTLMRLHRQYARRIDAEKNITPRDISVLRFIAEHEAVKVSEVQHYIHNSPSTASALIAGMEEAGYVRRTRSPEDRRVVLVTLTPAGHTLLQTTPLGGMPLLRRELRALSAQRLREMAGVLDEIQTMMLGEEAE